MWHAPRVRNHLGTVHAIALCNLAEYTMGAVAEATIPPSHRWVPKGMTVAYLEKARGTMHATARLELPAELADKQELPVEISVRDGEGTEVFTATIIIWVTARR
jgi:acyl-coenzyme A thioesterase PaaI-like protein